MARTSLAWPALPYAEWKDTAATLQLWTQIVGKIRLARTPWLNHSWQVTLYVSASGLTTSPIPDGGRVFEIEFDFLHHRLVIRVSDGRRREIALAPQTVAAFYARLRSALRTLGLETEIDEFPCEIHDAIPFSRDRVHRAYDADSVQRFFRVLVQADRILKRFRTGFLGKTSPVHFFWGSFDLAVTRFSGREAPHISTGAPGVAPAIMAEAYTHEVSSAGFWPGGSGFEDAAFYSYAYPEPKGFRRARIRPKAAFYNADLNQFLLPYEAVRRSADPERALLAFLTGTYEAAANGGRWDRKRLETPIGREGKPRRFG
jgi:hypothetical protein